MAEKKASLSSREKRLLAKLGEHPELFDRVESILNLTSQEGSGAVKSVDEIESLLIEELRKLGNQTLTSWAVNAEQKVSDDYRKNKAGVQQRCKKN